MLNLSVSIVIPVYSLTKKLFDITLNCLKSIRKFNTNYEIIIINNASPFFLPNELKNYVNRIVNLPFNSGFSFANNLGARIAKGNYLLFLNNDTIWEEDIVKKLLVDKEEFISGASGAKLKLENGVLVFHRWSMTDFDYIEGWCMFMKKSTFFKLGGFDETFGLAYSEDSDLCLKAKFIYKIPLIVVKYF